MGDCVSSLIFIGVVRCVMYAHSELEGTEEWRCTLFVLSIKILACVSKMCNTTDISCDILLAADELTFLSVTLLH